MKLALKVNESMASAPANLTAKNDLFTVLYNLALMEDELSLPKEFQVVSERMLALAEELIQINPTPQMKFGLHSVLSNLCWAYSTAKDPRADTILARSFALLEKQAKEDPKATTSRTILADLLLNLAHPGYDQADKAFIFANQIAAITPEELGAWELVAMRHLNLQHYPEAVAALERAITCIPAPRAGETPSSLYIKLNERLTRYRAKLATAARQ
jgi:tetratricopeptide (TPR) repeat protein